MLRRHCRDVGRDYDEIEKTTASVIDLGEDRKADVKGLLDHLRELAVTGIDQAILSPRGPWDNDTLDAVASIVQEVRGLPSSLEKTAS